MSLHFRRAMLPGVVAYVILTFLGLFFLIPFAWLVLAAINPSATFGVRIPSHPTLSNFSTIISNGIVGRPFLNSVILAGCSMVLTVLFAGLAAYPLSRYQFR